MTDQDKVQQALGNTTFKERVAAAAAILDVTEDTLATMLVETLGGDSPEDLEHITFQDLSENVSGAKPAPIRRALDVLKGDGKSKEKDGGVGDIIRALRDETRLLELTGGRPLLCEHGGIEHSAANIRHFQRTGQAPKVCVYAGCGKLLASMKCEVSFEDNRTFLAPDGTNPQTGRNEGKFPIADRALAFILIGRSKLTVDEAWRRLDEGSLRTHFAVDAAEIEAEEPGYASRLRQPFGGVRTGGADPFYRDRQGGHQRY